MWFGYHTIFPPPPIKEVNPDFTQDYCNGGKRNLSRELNSKHSAGK